MSTMSTESIIRDACERGLSRGAAQELVGVSRARFRMMLEAMPALPWPAQGKSIACRQSHQARKGHRTEAQRAHMARLHAHPKINRPHVLDGVAYSFEELAAISPVSAETIRKRMLAGMDLRQAVYTPPIPVRLRRKIGLQRKKLAAAGAAQ